MIDDPCARCMLEEYRCRCYADEARRSYGDPDSCTACLHLIGIHHPDNCIAGCSASGCGCSRTQLTAR
jgi:hypothetical protein